MLLRTKTNDPGRQLGDFLILLMQVYHSVRCTHALLIVLWEITQWFLHDTADNEMFREKIKKYHDVLSYAFASSLSRPPIFWA
jgi:hypothetical protein